MADFPGEFTGLSSGFLNENETVSNEVATIPASAPYVVIPEHPLKDEQPSNITISGFSEVGTGTPQLNEFSVDYINSRITFNVGNAGQAILISYETLGDKYVASMVNNANAAVNRVEQNIGLNAQGSQPTIAARLTAIESTNLINFVSNEVPSGTINGSNAVFTLVRTPIAGSDMIYRNGIRQRRGATKDYQIAGNQVTFNAGSILLTGDDLLADYRWL